MNEPSRLCGAIPSELPGDVVAYGRTPDFTLETLPEALTSGHTTKPGVWGLIHVLEGRLFYALEPPHIGQIVLAAGETAPIPPGIPHRVAFTECGRFFVEFHKRPRAASESDAAPSGTQRVPHVNAPGLAVGLDEALIRTVVEYFYARVRADQELAPLFEGIANWPAHLARMCDFWSSITLITGAYKGDVIGAHLSLPGLTDRHFLRWLELFGITTRKHCTPEQAAVFSSRALRMAESIKAARRRTA